MIENIELLAFVRENLALARTIVVKNEDLAILDNANMLKYSGIDSGTDKSKWRYYLNLNGEYHFTDEMMTVKSLDDNEMIDFTKENLENHPATKKAYRLGGYYFSRLVAQYPHQMELVQGIINPIPPEESVPAKNYQILRYTKEYIEWNESQLIPGLQDFINQTVYQSFNTEYKYTDDLLVPVLIAHLSEGIYKFLLECRFENRFSRHAHSFYIWSYLQSKGISPIYKDLLNNKQTMWLFRNIDWVLRNLGMAGTFQELIDILLSERDIPLSKYDLIQSTETMSKDLHSEPLFFSERLNLIETRGLGQQTNKIAATMLREIPESLDNELYYDKYLPTTTEESTYGEETNYPTKILDSELVDTTNRKPETIFNLINNELIYLAGNNLYNINLDIEDPLSGIHQRVSVKDAIVLWHHLLNKYNGADCTSIPSFYYQGVLKIVPPTIETMQSVGAKPFLNEEWCRDVLKTYVPQIKIVSPSIFYENAMDIFNLKWDHVKMYSRWLSIGYYSRRKNAISTMYETGFMKLTDKETYSEFLEQYDFDFTTYQKEDYFSLMWEIWRKMTGWDQFSHITIGQIQDGMIGLMKFLSSYSVQYIHQTTMEEGWYEGGLDLMTENPGLLHPDGDGQLELESGVESNRIPVHHRVVMTAEEEETLYLEDRFDHGTTSAEMGMNAKVFETPKLYPVDLPDTDKDDGFHGSQVMDFDQKLRLFTGKLPYDLEDLIPEGGNRAEEYTLKEMIVDSFEGIQKVGPWKATGIWIVENKGLDNTAVAEDVDGFEYARVMDTVAFTKDDVDYNRYYVGFVPALLDDNLIKLDVIAEHEETGELVHVRFDYNIKTKQNTWAISFEIPESVILNSPFSITPTITGLSLGEETIVNESYVVYPDIDEFLEVETTDGVLKGTFKKAGWPEELPLMYLLQTSNGNEDEELARHNYYMRGYVPSDRYYDPLLDPEFEPKGKYFEADLNAITMEHFSVTATNKGWEAVNLYIKKNSDGTYPTDLVRTDYEGITDYLSPRLTEQKYTDKTVDGKVVRTFEWLYAVAKENPTMTLILELKNEDDEVVYREFTYKPSVVNHGIDPTFDILPETGYKFGVDYSTDTKLTVGGLADTVTLIGGSTPIAIPGQSGKVAIGYDPEGSVDENEIYGYMVRPADLLESDIRFAVQVEVTTKAIDGGTLRLKPYGTFTILKSDVVNYDTIDPAAVKITGWENNTIYAHAVAPSRYAIADFENGWQAQAMEVTKTNGYWPDFVAKSLPGVSSATAITGFEPVIKTGVGTDGTQSVPTGYDRWFTIYMLANRDYLDGKEMELNIPITVTLKNKYSGKTGTVAISPLNNFSGVAFPSTKTPDELFASTDNVIVPSWTGLPFSTYGDDAELITNEGIFIGADKYKGGSGYTEETACTWNDDSTADIILPTAPITDGLGIIIYNKRTYRSKDSKFAGTSIQDVDYYPYVTYEKDKIIRVPVPKLEDFDFTPLGNVDFFKGVRSTYATLYNAAKIYEYKWAVSSVDLEVLGAEDQDEHIITVMNGKDVSGNAYTSGTQSNAVNDAPAGKSGYSNAYVGFVPAKTGKQTFGVLVTIVNQSVTGITPRTYRFEIEIDVKEQEGEIIYDTSYPDPWWLLGKETFVLTDVVGYSGNASSRKMQGATINDEDGKYASVRTAINSPLSSSLALAVTVPERFMGITLQAIVTHAVYFNGYLSTDPRRTRFYFGLLPISPDRLYTVDEINIGVVEFEPDIVFETMDVNQSYTERYKYNVNTRGWYINTIRVEDNSDWMNHYYEYDGSLTRNAQLYSVTSQNISKDKTIDAPEGKYFYLPRYGGRKIGTFPVSINMTLSSKHHSSSTTIKLTYSTERKIIPSDIKLNLTYDKIYVGQKNVFGGGMEGIPTSDVHEGIKAFTTTIAAIGPNYGYFKTTTSPLAVSVDASYKFGEGNGIMIGLGVPYTANVSGTTVESETWYRAYRGEQIIPEEDITVSADMFEVVPAYNTLMTGPVCTERFYVKTAASLASLGWVVNSIGIKGMTDGTADKSVFTTEAPGLGIDSLYFESKSVSSNWVINGVAKDGFVVSFALKHFTGKIVDGKEVRSITIPMVIKATFNNKQYEIPFEYVTTDILAGTDPTFGIGYANYNYWVVNDKDEKRTTMTVSGISGSYAQRNLSYVRPYGDNSSKTTVSTLNQGSIGGSANTVFRFSGVSETDFEYAVMANFVVSSADRELTMRRFFGTFTIASYRVQDYDNWDLSAFDFQINQYKPMFANEYSVLELKALGFKDGLGIGSVELVSFSNDVVLDYLTVDGVQQSTPLLYNYVLNVTADGKARASTNPECYCFLGFTPKYASDTVIKLRISLRVGYSSYVVSRIVEVPIKTFESRTHVGLIGDAVWTDTSEKKYQVVPHRVPLDGRDNMTLLGKQVGFFSNENNYGYWTGDDELTIVPAAAVLDKPLEIFVFYQFRDNNMVNAPAQRHGVFCRHRFYNNGYDWKLNKITTTKTGTRTSVTSAFDLYKNGEKSQDVENAAVPPARQIVNGLSHAVSYGGGVVTNGVYSRSYLTSYIPECYFDLQAIGDSVVAGNNAHIFTSGFDATFNQSKRLFCRSMYLNQAGNLVMEFAYNSGAFVNDWSSFPYSYELTKSVFQIGGANGVASRMADMTLVNMDIKDVANVGIVTFEFEKPASVTKFAYNALLTIDSVISFTLPGGIPVDLQIRVEKGRMTW